MCSRLVDNMKKHVLRPIVEGGHGGYRCASDLCDKIFTSAGTLKKHARTCTQQKCLAKMQRQCPTEAKRITRKRKRESREKRTPAKKVQVKESERKRKNKSREKQTPEERARENVSKRRRIQQLREKQMPEERAQANEAAKKGMKRLRQYDTLIDEVLDTLDILINYFELIDGKCRCGQPRM